MNNNDWKNVFPEVPQSFHETVQRTLETQILNKTGKKKGMKKRFPIVLAAVIAALGVTAAAAQVIQWNSKLAQRFGANEQQQTQLASDAAVASVDRTVADNGLTITALQTLGDKNGVYLLFSVKAPEGITLSDANGLDIDVDIEGAGRNFGLTCGFMNNSDLTASPSGAANERYYEVYLDNREKEDWNGKTITVNFANLTDAEPNDSPTGNERVVVEGNWKLSWTLSYSEKMQTFDINKTYEVNGHEVVVKAVSLSPLTMTLELDGSGLAQLVDNSDLKQAGSLCTLSLIKKDGTTFDSYSMKEGFSGSSYKRMDRFYQVQDVEQITGLKLTFCWEKANNTLTIALP